VYDPTIPLRSRFERSASQHQHAIESPLDVNPYATAGRTQQLPHVIGRYDLCGVALVGSVCICKPISL
jgi:hypothetical protein